MIEVRAFTEDGWVIFTQDKRYYAMWPPYHESDVREEATDPTEKVILCHGFLAAPANTFFNTRDELRTWIRERVVASNLANNIPQHSPEETATIIFRDAPPEVIERFLSRTEAELIKEQKYTEAAGFLRAVAQNTRLTPQLQERIATLQATLPPA